jgi:AraC-like DNA-binding protein
VATPSRRPAPRASEATAGPAPPEAPGAARPRPARSAIVGGVDLLPAATARALLAAFRALGLDDDALRAGADIAPEALEPVDGTLPAAAFARLWEGAFRRAPRDELPTEAGLAVPFGGFGALDYLAASSPDVRAAFHSLATHFRSVSAGFGMEVEEDGGAAEVRLVWERPNPARDVSDEFTLAVLVGRFRATAAFAAEQVRLTRPTPARPTRHARLLGAPVAFGCAVAALRVGAAAWRAPLRTADAALQDTLRHLSERLDLGRTSTDLERAVRVRLRGLLSQGRADAPTLARTLGLSARTLRRRLRDSGRSFQEIVDGFREAEAERLLSAPEAALAEVALRLGFSDQSAFTRAFRRWKGLPPTAWAAGLRAPAPPPGPSRRSRARPRRPRP